MSIVYHGEDKNGDSALFRKVRNILPELDNANAKPLNVSPEPGNIHTTKQRHTHLKKQTPLRRLHPTHHLSFSPLFLTAPSIGATTNATTNAPISTMNGA